VRTTVRAQQLSSQTISGKVGSCPPQESVKHKVFHHRRLCAREGRGVHGIETAARAPTELKSTYAGSCRRYAASVLVTSRPACARSWLNEGARRPCTLT